MIATIGTNGRIMIPRKIRERLGLKTGDHLEFEEKSSVLVARRVVNRDAWESTSKEWRKTAAASLKGHPWKTSPVSEIIDDLRGARTSQPASRVTTAVDPSGGP